jgi:class 3 adenylate cyclase
MKWLDSVVAWMFPSILLEGTPWRNVWLEKERDHFVLVAKVFFGSAGLIYLTHYFFYDRPNNLEPLGGWLAFRITMATLAFVALAYYSSKVSRTRYYRLLAIAVCWVICQSQAYVALLHGRESWIFCYILIVACVLGLRMSAFKSLGFALVAIGTQAPVLIKADLPGSYIFTGSIITVAVTLIVRASYLFEVRSFLLDQTNISNQKKIIELNMEFADRIRSFIPRIIAQRIDEHMDRRRMSVLEASIEVLTPRAVSIACLFSDIRGFTRESNDIEHFLRESVVPEIKSCTDAIEDLGGIPRKVGDLIFAYFDADDQSSNVLCCVVAALAISRINQAMNATANTRSIKRYVLASCGEALVGNIGGLDSSIEITALGAPVNYLSRLDELTKSPALGALLNPGDVVFSEAFHIVLSRLVPELKPERVDLAELGLSIRDFLDAQCIYILPATDTNYESVLRALNVENLNCGQRGDSRQVAA